MMFFSTNKWVHAFHTIQIIMDDHHLQNRPAICMEANFALTFEPFSVHFQGEWQYKPQLNWQLRIMTLSYVKIIWQIAALHAEST